MSSGCFVYLSVSRKWWPQDLVNGKVDAPGMQIKWER